MDSSAINLTVPVMTVVGFLFTAGWGLVVWLLRRMVAQVEKAVETVDLHTTELQLLRAEIQTLKATDTRLEREQDRDRILLDDLRGFLATQGFRKREG